MIKDLTPQNLDKAIELALADRHSLPPEIQLMNAPSSHNIRRMSNNFAKLLGTDLRYLEIGTEMGVSFVSALYGTNPDKAVVIDNWYNNYKIQFGWELAPIVRSNCARLIPNIDYQLIEKSSWDVNPNDFGFKFNFYFYDALHTHEDQKRAYTHYDCALEPIFLTTIDDWNVPYVRSGTIEAWRQLNYEILYFREWFTAFKDTTGGGGEWNTWWNGYAVALIRKRNI
jgi:hypothetical protein